MTSIHQIHSRLLNDALQRIQEPPRDYQIHSRSSTPSVYPESPGGFEYWKDTLNTHSRSLEALEASAEECRARILNDQYWQEESDHWKALYERNQRDDESASDRHSYEIDARFWKAMSTLNWQETYRALEMQNRHPRLMEQFDSDLRDRRTITTDIVYHKTAAEYWRNRCQSSKLSTSHRDAIRSSRYWQVEVDCLSEEIQKLRKLKEKHIQKRPRSTSASLSQGRRSERIASREKASTSAKPQGIRRRRNMGKWRCYG